MGEVGEAYAGCRSRITELVSALDDELVASSVPACPDWSVRDLVSHLAGITDDVLAGRLDGVATDAWTARQVESRRDRAVAEILEEWRNNALAFEQLLDSVGDPGRQAVADVVTHEHDIRGALAKPGARDADAVRIGLGFVTPGFVASAAVHGVQLLVRSTDGMTIGPDGAESTLTGDSFDLLRAITGRRSVDQLRAMQWQGDVDAVISAFTFGPFRPAAGRIDE